MQPITTGKQYLTAVRDAYTVAQPGTYLADPLVPIVYGMDYATIGTIMGEIFDLFDGVSVTLEVDGHNALEELLIALTFEGLRADDCLTETFDADLFTELYLAGE